MGTRVCITGLSGDKLEHIDRVLGGTSWRYDVSNNGIDTYDVDVSNTCDVLYVSNDTATNAIVLCIGDLTVGIKRNEFNSIIAG